MTVNLDQRHLASDCNAVGERNCGAWYKTECVWCQAEIHMHRKQYNKHVQTCSSRCRVALHRARVAAEGRAPQGPPP